MSEETTAAEPVEGAVPVEETEPVEGTGLGLLTPAMRPFLALWSGQALSLFGSQVVQFALVWWLARETGSATILATATMIAILPQVLLGPLFGTLVDRWNRKRVMLVSDAVVAASTAVLAVLFFVGMATPTSVFLILLVRAIGGGFHSPAMMASTSLMVPREHLTRIQGLNQTLQAGLTIIAAPLGAVLLSLLPFGGIILIDVVTAAIALAVLAVVHVPQPSASADSPQRSMLRELGAGFSYVRSRRGLLALVAMAAVINLAVVPAFALLPLLIQDHFQRDALALGGMMSAFGLGALVGGILLTLWGGFRRRILTSLAAITGIGLFTLVIGLVPGSMFWAATAAFAVLGMLQPLANGPIQAVMQATVSPDYQGRVFTLLGSAAGAMAPVGLAIAGPVADLVGVQAWFVAGGIVCTVMGLGAFMIPAIVYIEDEGDPSSVEAPAA